MNNYDFFYKLYAFRNDNDINDYDFYLKNYINFLDNNKYLQKVNTISNTILNNYHVINNNVLEDLNLSKNEISNILSIIIFKSINKFSLNDTIKQINYLKSDSIINDICDSILNIYIYCLEKEIIKEAYKIFRGSIFKILEILVLDEQVYTKKIYYNSKSITYYSFNYENIELTKADHLKISFKPFRFVTINENCYLIGSFFTMVKKIFIENTLSNIYFKINDIKYVEKMCKSELYLNLTDLKNIVDIFHEKKIDINGIQNEVNCLNTSIADNLNNVKNLQKEFKKLLYENARKSSISIKEESVDFKSTKKVIIDKFYEYSKKIINQKEIILNDNNKFLFLLILYESFIKKFSNAYVKLEFENLNDFLSWKNNLKEYGISFTNDISKIINKKKKIKINKKINPQDIGFLGYVSIYTKKEVKEILEKIEKKELDIENRTIDINSVNKNIIESYENIDIYETLMGFLIKYGEMTYQNLEIKKLINEIKMLNYTNKKSYSRISKILRIYDILILYDYIKEKKQENIKIYFMFFFDFRGRLYYDSVVSPTSNKFCRLIYNYGVYDKKKIAYDISDVSIHVMRYIEYIKIVKEIFKIEENTSFINDSIFWLMISIGKLNINKSKKIVETEEFLKECIKLIKHRDSSKESLFKNDIELAEFNYYLTIIKSIREDTFYRRCLIKDATASFFQNLIRLLGEKNNECLKMANLKSWDCWYDWYAFVLDEWLDDEKNRKLYVEGKYEYFVRKTIKKVVMTVPYSASFSTCFDYFKESVFENFNKEVNINDETGDIFKRFYGFLKNQFKKNGPFRENPQKINEHFKNVLDKGDHVIIITRLEDSSNLTYFKTITRHFDFIIRFENNKKRIIKNYKEIDKNIIDKKKTTQALNANLIHCIDSLLVRDINSEIYTKNKNYYISIHDSFMVDFTETSRFILIANNQANKNIFKEEIWNNKKEYFSLYIFL